MVIVARIGDEYHFRIFSEDGEVRDRSESELAKKTAELTEIKQILETISNAESVQSDAKPRLSNKVVAICGVASWATKRFRCIDVKSQELGESRPFTIRNPDFLHYRIQLSPDGKRLTSWMLWQYSFGFRDTRLAACRRIRSRRRGMVPLLVVGLAIACSWH